MKFYETCWDFVNITVLWGYVWWCFSWWVVFCCLVFIKYNVNGCYWVYTFLCYYVIKKVDQVFAADPKLKFVYIKCFKSSVGFRWPADNIFIKATCGAGLSNSLHNINGIQLVGTPDVTVTSSLLWTHLNGEPQNFCYLLIIAVISWNSILTYNVWFIN